MLDIILEIFGSSAANLDIALSVCGALIVILVCVFIDLVYRVLSHVWR